MKSLELPAEELQQRLLNEADVACLVGTAFGSWGEGYLRLSYANSVDNIRHALDSIEEFTARLCFARFSVGTGSPLSGDRFVVLDHAITIEVEHGSFVAIAYACRAAVITGQFDPTSHPRSGHDGVIATARHDLQAHGCGGVAVLPKA